MSKQEKKLLGVFEGKTYSTPPMWLMRQAGRYLPEYRKVRAETGSFLNLCYTPEKAAEVTLQPIKRFDFDAAIIFSDILVVPNALGMELDYIGERGPVLSALKTEKDIHSLKRKKTRERLAPVFEAISLVRKELSNDKTLIGFAGAPWTVALYMLEGGSSKGNYFSRAINFIRTDRALFEQLIQILVEETAEYLIAQIEAGAEIIQIFETWAELLPDQDVKHFAIDPVRKIIEKIKVEFPDVPIIGFPKGIGAHLEEYMQQTMIDGIGIDYHVPIKWAAAKLQPFLPVQGNLDPNILATDADAMEEEVRRILEVMGKKHFIFNLGHGILPTTPIENVERLVNIVRSVKK